MASKRIRYTKSKKKGFIRSVKHFKGQQGAKYVVFIDTNEHKYYIRNVISYKIVRSTDKDGKRAPKNIYTVYEQVKRALKTIGVTFEREMRGLDV